VFMLSLAFVPSPMHFLLFPRFPSTPDSPSVVSKSMCFLHIASHSLTETLNVLTEVRVVLSLFSFSSVGVPGVVHASNSPILLQKP
jgi:hypothetical protein